jgi:DEAD/DEAH box helicase domain-containing protein
MPLAESALYLENPRIQYIHAMCLARPHGEDDAIRSSGDLPDELQVYTDFPDRFVALCNRERIGEVSSEFQMMKSQAGDDPNHVFPLRDCDIQYNVETAWSEGPARPLGSLSFGQVMREAYPGAVYYYQTEPFRVVRILFRDHKIIVRPEKRYTTKPSRIPTLIFPNLSEGNVYGAQSYAELRLVECNLQIQETIVGFKERRGPNEFSQSYPLNPDLGLFFDLPRFQRNYFSSGVLFLHPAMDRSDVNREMLVELLLEAFVMEVPFERQDLGCGSDRIRVARGGVAEGQRFLCIYDQTYGSLRLTSRLLESSVLRGVLEKALDIAQNDDAFDVRGATLDALLGLHRCVCEEPTSEPLFREPEIPPENCTRVILPGSVGLYPDYENEEFCVEAVFFSPKGLMYRGRRLSKQGKQYEKLDFSVPVDKIVPIEGLSVCGFYNYDRGEIETGAEEQSHCADNLPPAAVVP